MRIGVIAPPWIPVPPPAYGGTESVIANLVRGLSERGHEVTLFTVGESTSGVHQEFLFNRPMAPIGQSVPEAAHVLAAYQALGEVDIIHDHTFLGPLLAPLSPNGPPVVTTNHGPFTPLTRELFRAVAGRASIVAISADQASRAGDIPIAAVIHHGIDLDSYRFGAGGGDHLLFIGRMSPDKGVASAVRIAHAAGRPLRIVSKMREREERDYFAAEVLPLLSRESDEVAELGLEERIDLLGSAIGLVNPIAWAEPFGLVMAESLAAGTPVITRPEGAAPEIVTHGRTGFLCALEEDAVAAVDRLGGIDRRACRADAERRFSLGRMAADHERLYERILSSRRSSNVARLRVARPDQLADFAGARIAQ